MRIRGISAAVINLVLRLCLSRLAGDAHLCKYVFSIPSVHAMF